MARLARAARRAIGGRAARSQMFTADKIWSRYSNDKVDIAHHLAHVIRVLNRSLPLTRPLRALSIGSSNEPQFRILESACRGGLYLLDIEAAALDIVTERIRRQRTDHVGTVRGDYRALLRDERCARRFRAQHLGGRRMTLVTLHHALYYSPEPAWLPLVAGLYRALLAGGAGRGPTAAIHAVLMANRSRDPCSTTWLYNHFAGTYFGVRNDQDLRRFGRGLRRDRRFAGARVVSARSRVAFFAPDFEQFMGVVWMILLHPTVHRFSPAQQDAIIEHVYRHLWSRGLPLVQEQDHLIIYRSGAT
jgi:hypothetical protein